jgi:hypothetical protein
MNGVGNLRLLSLDTAKNRPGTDYGDHLTKMTLKPSKMRRRRILKGHDITARVPWSRVLLEKPIITQLVNNHPSFMEPQGSLPCSQKPVIGTYTWARCIQSSSSHPGWLSGIALGYGLGDRGFESQQGLEFFSSQPRPERLWCPPSLLSNRYQGLFPWSKAARAWSYTSTSQFAFRAWCSIKPQGQLYFTILILSPHLRLGFPSGLLLPDFPTKNFVCISHHLKTDVKFHV